MTPWFIVRTDLGKELAVARAIAAMGCEVWVPLRFKRYRKRTCRVVDQIAYLPTMAFAAIPVALHGDLHAIRHFRGLMRDSACSPLKISCKQLSVFRTCHEAWLERERIRIVGRKPGKPEKPKARTWEEVKKILFPDLAEVEAA